MTFAEAERRVRALNPLYLCVVPKHAAPRDLIIEHPGYNVGCDFDGWTFSQMRAIAGALGTAAIDLVPDSDHARGWPEGHPVEYEGGGCETCGHGDMIVVRGIIGG